MNKGLTLRMNQASVKRLLPRLIEHVRAGHINPKAMIMGIRHMSVDAEQGIDIIPNSGAGVLAASATEGLREACLEALTEAGNPFSIITRSPLVVRDLDMDDVRQKVAAQQG